MRGRYDGVLQRGALITCVGLLTACGGGGAGSGGDGNPDGGSGSLPPKTGSPYSISAGSDQEVVEGTLVALDASASPAADGSVVTYQWTQLSGPSAALSANDRQNPAFVAPPTDLAIALVFELTVTDGTDRRSRDSVTVTVHPDEPPTLSVSFPCDGCRFTGDVLTLTGTLDPHSAPAALAGAETVAVVSVDTGTGEVEASVSGRRWIAQNVPIDDQSATVSVTITARDALGRQSQQLVTLHQAHTITGGLIATAADPVQQDRLYLMETSHGRGRLLEVNLATDKIRVVWEAGRFENDFGQTSAIVVDGNRNRLLVLDRGYRALRALDLLDGQQSLLSNDAAGAGPSFARPAAMMLDPLADRVLVADNGLKAIFGVDLVSGDRSILSSTVDNDAADTPIFRVVDMTLDTATGMAILLQGPDEDVGILGQFLVAVDLNTGQRMPIGKLTYYQSSVDFDAARDRFVLWSSDADAMINLDPATPGGAILSDGSIHGSVTGSARHARVDAISDRYMINDFSGNTEAPDTNTLVAVDPETGKRSVVFRDALGTGPRVLSGINLDLHSAANTLYLLDFGSQSLISVDLSTADRSLVSGSSRGNGPAFSGVRDLAIEAGKRIAYVLDHGGSHGQVMSVDLDTGSRTIVSGTFVGAGPQLIEPDALALDRSGTRLYLADAGMDAILSVDLASGDRSILSDGSSVGDPLLTPTGITVDAAANRLLVTDEGEGGTHSMRVFAVDLDTGTRSVVTSSAVGSGTFLQHARDVALLPDNNLAIVAAMDTLMLVDLATGNRSIIADTDIGIGEAVHNIAKIALDPDKRVIYGWSPNFEAVFQFDLVTGDRVVVSK